MALHIPAKSTLGALFEPLFGQFQKGCSPKFERHKLLAVANHRNARPLVMDNVAY
jgi:hypothetical protein